MKLVNNFFQNKESLWKCGLNNFFVVLTIFLDKQLMFINCPEFGEVVNTT